MLERTLQRKIITALRGAGYIACKFESPGQRGVPDLLVLWRGRAAFIEVKRPGTAPTVQQRMQMDRLAAAGAVVGVATSVSEALDVAAKLRLEPRFVR